MEILKHETDIDISHKLNNYELKVWLKHLKHIEKELIALEKIWSIDLDDEINDNIIIQQLAEKKIELDALYNTLDDYIVKKPNDAFCEDFQCDIDIITEHEENRNKYLKFLKHYRNIKNVIYQRIQGKPVTTNFSELHYA